MDPRTAFAGMKPDQASICLLHNPAHILEMLEYPWQWMLAGHTHGRQVGGGRLGRTLYPERYRHYTHGLYTINGRYLYVNRGLSYGQRAHEWCRPEITVFEVKPASTAKAAKIA
jgi:predicted MPP superfamily phosphohydrolase